jgi:hypothetical protein
MGRPKMMLALDALDRLFQSLDQICGGRRPRSM